MSRFPISPPTKSIDYFYEGLAFLGLILGFLIALFAYDSLPEQIPSHINANGEVDNYSSKQFIWGLPIIALFLYILLTVINKSPHLFNYPVKVTTENAAQQYGIAVRLNRMIKAWCCLFFALFTYQFIQLANSGSEEMGMMSVMVFVVGIIGIVGYYWWMSSKKA